MLRKPYPTDVSEEVWSFAGPCLALMEAGCFEAMVSDLHSIIDAEREHDIALQIVKLPEAKQDFVLLPKRWVVDRRFGWLTRVRRLSRDYDLLPEALMGVHFLVFAMLMLPNAAQLLASAGSS